MIEIFNDKNTRAALESLSSDERRLDEFYIYLLNNYKKPCRDLKHTIKIFVVLPHENARVKSGFSRNKGISEVNMKESSLVAQRFVYEGILKKVAYSKLISTKS